MEFNDGMIFFLHLGSIRVPIFFTHEFTSSPVHHIMNKFLPFLTRLRKAPEYRSVRGVVLFIVITLIIHISFRFWVHHLHYFPIERLYAGASVFMENLVFQQANWVLTRILQIPVKTYDLSLWFTNNKGIIIGDGCTGLKQIIQVSLLFLIYPGPWKHKAWFIPAGILVMHITNIVRITLLGIAINLNLPGIHFLHSYILRLLFYIVIFGLWWIWDEKIVRRGFH